MSEQDKVFQAPERYSNDRWGFEAGQAEMLRLAYRYDQLWRYHAAQYALCAKISIHQCNELADQADQMVARAQDDISSHAPHLLGLWRDQVARRQVKAISTNKAHNNYAWRSAHASMDCFIRAHQFLVQQVIQPRDGVFVYDPLETGMSYEELDPGARIEGDYYELLASLSKN